MEKDILVILMVAFGIFAIVMFILFFVYLKKYYNNKHINDDYRKEVDDFEELEDVTPPITGVVPPLGETVVEPISIEPQVESPAKKDDYESDMEFVPIKKK